MIGPLLLLAQAAASTPPAVLTLNDALATARSVQPQVRAAIAATAAAQARSDEAFAALLPQVFGNAEYQRGTANVVSRPGAIVGQPAPAFNWKTFGSYNLGVTANQLIYDFGQTSGRWHAAQANEAAQRESEKTTLSEVLFTVRTSFFQARAAKGLVDVAKETLADQQKHLEQTQGFVDVGTQAEIALAQAKASVANAKVGLITAENGYRTSKAQLNQAMGVERSLDYDVADDSAPAVEGETGTADSLLDEAIKARPEMTVLANQVSAQELTVSAIRGAYGPTLGLTADLTDAAFEPGALVTNWAVGITLDVPIFQGGQTKAQVREAEANLDALKAQVELERLQIRLDVEQALLAVRAARESISAAEDALASAHDQLRLAEGRYETGVGSIIELTDAQVAYTSAGQQKVQTEYNLASARAQLLKALGRN